MIDAIVARERTGRRISEIKDELGTAMNRYCAVFRDGDGLQKCHEIVRRLKERDIGVLITDHNVRETLAITDRAYILYNGQILASGTAAELAQNPRAREIYLGEKFSL